MTIIKQMGRHVKKLLKIHANTKKKVFRIKPPMCITKDDADFTLSVFEDALKEQMKK